MSYNPDSPANAVAEEIRENFRALKEDRIVAADSATTSDLATTAERCTGNAATATKLETARAINGVAFDGTANITITAGANGGTADTAAKLATARTISLTGDATGSATFDGSTDMSIAVDVTSADTATACTGNAATSTKLEIARTINGVSFDGTADITITAEANGGNADTATKATTADSATTAENCTGNAATATKLATARKINEVLFDGTENITITQLNGKDIATTDKIPTSLPANGGNADTVDGKHAVDFAPAGYIPPNVTETTDGSLSAADKVKLDGIEAGAQVNQNAFSNIVVNGTAIHANSQNDTLELAGGKNIALTADATNENVTIAVTGKVASAVYADSATKSTTADLAIIAESCTGNAATATKLATARKIAGVSFDGTADIEIPYSGVIGASGKQLFTKSGTFTVPNGVTLVKVTCVGGGGGGGGKYSTQSSGYGWGGGSGAIARDVCLDVVSGQEITVTIGAGGAGGTTANGAKGGTGGTTSFGALISCAGGKGGGQSNDPADPGLGGGVPIYPYSGTYYPGGDAYTGNWFSGANGAISLGVYAKVGSCVSAIVPGGGGNGSATNGRIGGAGKSGYVLVEW